MMAVVLTTGQPPQPRLIPESEKRRVREEKEKEATRPLLRAPHARSTSGARRAGPHRGRTRARAHIRTRARASFVFVFVRTLYMTGGSDAGTNTTPAIGLPSQQRPMLTVNSAVRNEQQEQPRQDKELLARDRERRLKHEEHQTIITTGLIAGRWSVLCRR